MKPLRFEWDEVKAKSNLKKHKVSFEEARLVLECKKLYFQDINPSHFLDGSIEKMYDNDYHRMYIGEITGIRKK